MPERSRTIESAEAQQDSTIAQMQSKTRERFNAVVNGANDAVEVGVTAASYTIGRTKRTFHEMLRNYSEGRNGGKYGEAA